MITCTQKGARYLLQPNEYVDVCTQKGANKFNHCTKKGAQHTKIDYICTMRKKELNIEPATSKHYTVKGGEDLEYGIMTGLKIRFSFRDRLRILMGGSVGVGITVIIDQPAKPVTSHHSCTWL